MPDEEEGSSGLDVGDGPGEELDVVNGLDLESSVEETGGCSFDTDLGFTPSDTDGTPSEPSSTDCSSV